MPRPPGPAAVGLRPEVRAALDLALVRAAAWIIPPAALVAGGLAIAEGDRALLVVSILGLVVALTAAVQLAAGRPRAMAMNLLAGATIGVAGAFLSPALSAALGTGLIVLTMTGVPLVSRRWLVPYLLAMTGLWLAHLTIRHVLADWAAGAVAAYIAQIVFLAFGVPAMMAMRRQVTRSESRYAYLFAHAPVALWENDFSGVGKWMDGLRAAGVEDLRSHLAANPEELLRGIGRVVTTDANPEAARLLAADDPADLRGGFPSEIVDAASQRLFLEQFVSIWEGGDTDDLDYTGRRLDGTTFQGILRSSPGEGRDLSRIVTAVSDVTRLRSVEEELRSTETTARALLDALPDLLFLMDADGTYLDYHVSGGDRLSASTESDLYVPPDHFLGKKPADVLPPDLAGEIMITMATALETDHLQTFEYDLPIDGQERHWEMRMAPLAGRDQVLALVRDVTEAVRARRELQRLVQSKDDFIAAISHELRTPLTGIVGFAHVLTEDTGMDPEERHQMIETLAAQSNDLTNIVEDLLVAARADLGRLEFAAVPTDLRAQVAQVLETWSPESVRRLPVIGEGVVCRSDPARVRQIIRNLVGNALRYGGGTIRIRIERNGPNGVLTVCDDGPGIPDDQAEQVFQAYHRAAPRDGLSAGLGIGLPIARTLARLMHGDLTYLHTGDEARFSLTLPLNSTAPASEGTAGTAVGLLGRAAPG